LNCSSQSNGISAIYRVRRWFFDCCRDCSPTSNAGALVRAPALSSFNLVTAAEDKAGRLEARTVFLPPEVVTVVEPGARPEAVAVVAAELDAQPEVAVAVAGAAEPDAQPEAPAVVAAEPDAQPEAAVVVAAEPDAQPEAVAAVVAAEPHAQPEAAVAAAEPDAQPEAVVVSAETDARPEAPAVEQPGERRMVPWVEMAQTAVVRLWNRAAVLSAAVLAPRVVPVATEQTAVDPSSRRESFLPRAPE
jgi:hypothetical protein